MMRTALSLAAVALLCMGAAPAKPQAKAPAKPAAAAKPAARAPASKSATRAPSGFNPGDPAVMVALLGSVDAQAKVDRQEGDAVYLAVHSVSGDFSAQFAGCNAQGKACQAILFDQLGVGAPTLAQVNGFNQTSVMCRAYQDKAGKAHVEYSALLFPGNSREEMLMHLNAWRGCLADFAEFSKDPIAYLANAA